MHFAQICNQFNGPTRREISLQKEITAIKDEMATLSMVDDFAKYSKLKRKLNQFTLSLESDGNEGIFEDRKSVV